MVGNKKTKDLAISVACNRDREVFYFLEINHHPAYGTFFPQKALLLFAFRLRVELEEAGFHDVVIRDGGLHGVEYHSVVSAGDGEEHVLAPYESIGGQGAEEVYEISIGASG